MSKLLLTPTDTDRTLDGKAVRTLARSVHREMREAGYTSAQVVDFASTIIDLVRAQVRDENAVRDGDLAAE